MGTARLPPPIRGMWRSTPGVRSSILFHSVHVRWSTKEFWCCHDLARSRTVARPRLGQSKKSGVYKEVLKGSTDLIHQAHPERQSLCVLMKMCSSVFPTVGPKLASVDSSVDASRCFASPKVLKPSNHRKQRLGPTSGFHPACLHHTTVATTTLCLVASPPPPPFASVERVPSHPLRPSAEGIG